MSNHHGPGLDGNRRCEVLQWMATLPAAGLAGMPFAAMGAAPTGPPEAIARGILDFTPENQAATFRNIDRLYAIHPIARGPKVSPLPTHRISLEDMTFAHQGVSYSLDQYMARNRTAGLLVLKDGAVALERYAMGNRPTSRWTSMSVAKSVTSTLVGAALKDGKIASLDDPVVLYAPVLAGSAYDAVSVRQLLRMTSGVAWNEAYSSIGDSGIAEITRVLRDRQQGGLMQMMRQRPRAAAPGTQFLYSTGETVVERVVAAIWSAWPHAWVRPSEFETYAMLSKAIASLH